MTTERALQMRRLALSVVRAKGITLLEGGATLLQYRYGRLTIFYRPSDGWLDVWFVQKVLSVEQLEDEPQLIQYAPGIWETRLIEAAKVAA
jgi:hypothetical protein